MKYYKLMYNYEKSDPYISCDVTDLYGMDRYAVTDGKMMGNTWRKLMLFFNPDQGHEFTDFLHNAYGWLVVSDKFIEMTQEYISQAVEYLDISIENSSDKTVYDNYKLANVIDVIDALDLKNSDYHVFTLDDDDDDSEEIDYSLSELGDDKALAVEKYALKKDVIKGHHIFKLQYDTIPVFVSEEIKHIIEENNMTGFSFSEVRT